MSFDFLVSILHESVIVLRLLIEVYCLLLDSKECCVVQYLFDQGVYNYQFFL